jgi:transcriptional regulator with XRE-family HTH domain
LLTNYDSSYERFIELLVAARKSAHCTQAELGDRLGHPQSFVSKVETRERRLDLVEFAYWCDALGVDAHALLTALFAEIKRGAPYKVRRHIKAGS